MRCDPATARFSMIGSPTRFTTSTRTFVLTSPRPLPSTFPHHAAQEPLVATPVAARVQRRRSVAYIGRPKCAATGRCRSGGTQDDDPGGLRLPAERGVSHQRFVAAERFGLLDRGKRGKDGEIHHRPGRDVTMSAPTSVWLVAMIGGDARIVAAHDRAVRTTLGWIEKHAVLTRMQDGTGPMVHAGDQKRVVAAFRHDTSRNLHPQIHAHCVIANMVQDGDGKWRTMAGPGVRAHSQAAEVATGDWSVNTSTWSSDRRKKARHMATSSQLFQVP